MEIHEIIEKVSPYYAKKKGPEASHEIVYDSSSDIVEQIYFFIFDFLEELDFDVEKLVDNFSQAPGSSNFAEWGQRKTIMQQQGSKLLLDINGVLRSVLNIIYDLKEFKIRLQSYDDLKTSQKDAAILSLKQIWMDKVDINKGNSSLKAMGLGQAGFVTLIDAFLATNTEKEVLNLDLNERVKRILLPRVQEFKIWLDQSERELRKRYELEKTYLKSQVSSLKLYSRWAKPYLKAAQELEGKESGRNANLVKTFNTVLLDLTLLAKKNMKDEIQQAAIDGKLPRDFMKIADRLKRQYHSCILVDFNFRAVPRQGVYIGKSTINLNAYALNDDEINAINEELKKDDLNDVLKLIEGATTESIGQLEEEINSFLEETKREESKEEKSSDQSNPFTALIGGYNGKSEKKQTKEEKAKPVTPDNWLEKTHLRPFAANDAVKFAFVVFDVYKKAHGMPSYT